MSYEKCALKNSKVMEDEFKEWQLKHDCHINLLGSSTAMETELLSFGTDQLKPTR